MSNNGPKVSSEKKGGYLVFTVNFTHERESLGLDLDIEDRKTAQVCHLWPGPITSYNSKVAPEQRLAELDYIVEVNEIKNNAQEMLQKMSSDTKLKFSVKRPYKFSIDICRDDEGSLGLELVYAPNGASLLIRAVKDGKVKEWNNARPNKAVQDNDRIVEVNGAKADKTVAPLLDKLKQKTQLKIVIARPMPDELEAMGCPTDRSSDMPTPDEFPKKPTQVSPTAMPTPVPPAEEKTNETANNVDAQFEEEANETANNADAKFDESVAQLVGMGFTNDQATDALLKTGGNFDDALGLLIQ